METQQQYQIGLHRNIPDTIYHHSWKFVSQSMLKNFDRTPAHAKYRMDNPIEPTDDMLLGQAIHASILEPDKFALRYIKTPKLDRRKTEDKAKWAALIAEYGEDRLLKIDDYETCQRIRDAVWKQSETAKFLRKITDVELSGIWVDPETKLVCKMRADALSRGVFLLDIKSCQSARWADFSKDILYRGYHVQAAMYLMALETLGEKVDTFVVIATEKEEPYCSALYYIEQPSIDLGRAKVREYLKKYKACLDANQFPGYPNDIQSIGVPAYALNEVYNQQ